MGEAGSGLVVFFIAWSCGWCRARGWGRARCSLRSRTRGGLRSWTRSSLRGWPWRFLALRLRGWAWGFLTLRSRLWTRRLLLRCGTRLRLLLLNALLLLGLLLDALLLLRLRTLRLLLSALWLLLLGLNALWLGLRALLILEVALLCALLLHGSTLLLNGVVALLLWLYAALLCALLWRYPALGFRTTLLSALLLLVLCGTGGAALLWVVALLDLLAALLLLLNGAGSFCDAGRTSGKAGRTSVCGLCGASAVGGVELLAVLRGRLTDLRLCGDGACARLAHGGQLRGARLYVDAAASAVVADTVLNAASVGYVVVDHVAAVDVSCEADVGDGAVVVEVVAVPVAAEVADTDVAEAVVNTAVVADVRAPVAAVEAVASAVETPVGRGPKSAVVGRRAPDAGNPVVAGRAPGPVAGCPEVVGIGGVGLIVVRERWWGLGGVLGDVLRVVYGLVGRGLIGSVVGVALLDGRRRLLAVGVAFRLLLRRVGSAGAQDLCGLAVVAAGG